MNKTLTCACALALTTMALALAGCGSSSGSSSASSSNVASVATSSSTTTTTAAAKAAKAGKGATHHVTVAIRNYKFAPVKLKIKAGTSVTFANHDTTAHTATANNGFDSGTIKPGGSATVKFSKPGTYPYICQFHAFMHGTVVVQ